MSIDCFSKKQMKESCAKLTGPVSRISIFVCIDHTGPKQKYIVYLAKLAITWFLNLQTCSIDILFKLKLLFVEKQNNVIRILVNSGLIFHHVLLLYSAFNFWTLYSISGSQPMYFFVVSGNVNCDSSRLDQSTFRVSGTVKDALRDWFKKNLDKNKN